MLQENILTYIQTEMPGKSVIFLSIFVPYNLDSEPPALSSCCCDSFDFRGVSHESCKLITSLKLSIYHETHEFNYS